MPTATKLMLATLVIATGGCASTPGGSTPNGPPADATAASTAVDGTLPAAAAVDVPVPAGFSITVTVRGDDALPRQLLAHLRPGKFIVFPDGSLHHGGADADALERFDVRRLAGVRAEFELPDVVPVRQLPLRTRVLTERQMEDLWTLALDLGFADAARGLAPINLDLVEPPAGGLVYLFDFVGDGRRWVFVLPMETPPFPDDPAVRLIRRMAALAWVTDRVGPRLATAPIRYDFGPDPYERYRR